MDTTLIVDDEKHCIDNMLDLISQCSFEFDFIITAQSVEEAVYKTKEFKPDLIFLDIHLGNQTGFDFLSKIKKRDFELIFITAYNQYAIKAFKFSALDYLLKPINPEDFKRALREYKNKESRKYLKNKMNVLLNNLKNDISKRKIAISSQEGLEFLDLNKIVRLEADGNYTHIFMKKGTKITASKNLKFFEEMLSDSNFFRVHHSHMINLALVKKYYRGKGGYLVMDDDTSVNVSIRKKEGLLKYLSEQY